MRVRAGRVRRAARGQRLGQVDAAEGAARRAGAGGRRVTRARAAAGGQQQRRSATCRSGAPSPQGRACAGATSCAWASTATAGGCRCRSRGARRERAHARRSGAWRRRSSWSARRLCRAADRRVLGRRAAAPADRPGARAPPELLLLDEPLDSLDLPNQAAVAALVGEICRSEGVAVLLVAHDVNPLLAYLDRVVYLAGGHAVEGPVRGGRSRARR